MSRCAGLAGLLFGHKYGARYSYGPPTLTRLSGSASVDAEKIIAASRAAIYVRDVCERCGDAVVAPAWLVRGGA
jgi:hypothetical protein